MNSEKEKEICIYGSDCPSLHNNSFNRKLKLNSIMPICLKNHSEKVVPKKVIVRECFTDNTQIKKKSNTLLSYITKVFKVQNT